MGKSELQLVLLDPATLTFFFILLQMIFFTYYNSLNELSIKPIQIFKDRHYVLHLRATFFLLFNCWEAFFFLV